MRRALIALFAVALALLLSSCGYDGLCDASIPSNRPEALLQAILCVDAATPTVSAAIDADKTTVASGETVTFSAGHSRTSDSDRDPIVRYTWDFGDGSPSQTQFAVAGTPPFPLAPHVYTVSAQTEEKITLVVEDDLGNTATAIGFVTVTPPSSGPVSASFTERQTTASPETPVTFDGSSSTGQIMSYSWAFGDGTSKTGPEAMVTHSYFCTGTLSVTLTVTDDRGRIASTKRSLVITDHTGFSPCPSAQARDARAHPASIFRARFASTRIIRHGTLTRHGHMTSVRGILIAGRLDGGLVGSAALARFARTPFKAALTITSNDASRLTTITGLAFARLPGKSRGSICIRVGMTRHGKALPRGSFTVVGGTGAAARLSGSGSFVYAVGRDGTARVAGRLHSHGSRRQPLPVACRQLAGKRT